MRRSRGVESAALSARGISASRIFGNRVLAEDAADQILARLFSRHAVRFGHEARVCGIQIVSCRSFGSLLLITHLDQIVDSSDAVPLMVMAKESIKPGCGSNGDPDYF